MAITVRLFRPDEASLYRATRLKALKTDPYVFGAKYEDAEKMLEDKWEEDLTNPDLGVFGVFNQEECIGMTGVAIDKEDPRRASAKLWGSWLEPAWRGQGISRLMYDARLGWGKKHPHVRRIIVSHRKSNTASKMANQKHGFTILRQEDHLWHDGVSEPEVFYELLVK